MLKKFLEGKILTKLAFFQLINLISIFLLFGIIMQNIKAIMKEEIFKMVSIKFGFSFIIVMLFQIILLFGIYLSIKKPLEKFQYLMARLAQGDLSKKYNIESVNCSEIIGCSQNECPDYKSDDVLCWFDVGSYAPEFGQKVYCPKITKGEYKTCKECKVYKKVIKNEVLELGAWYNKFLRVFRKDIETIKNNSLILASSSEELSVGMKSISDGAINQTQYATELSTEVIKLSEKMSDVLSNIKEQSTSTEETSGTLSEISTSIEELFITTGNVEELSKQTFERAEIGKNTITRSSQEISNIGDIVKGIEETILNINNISEQTNLLALNAAIEAARAGEAGRGFAIVADEVRKLAESTSQSVGGISDLLKNAKSSMETNFSLSENSQEKMTEIIEKVNSTNSEIKKVSKIMELQVESVKEVSKAVYVIAEGSGNIESISLKQMESFNDVQNKVENISKITEQASAATEQTFAVSQNLSAVADELKEIVERFRL